MWARMDHESVCMSEVDPEKMTGGQGLKVLSCFDSDGA